MKLARIILAAALIALPARAADRVIPAYGDEALIIPEGSPVTLGEMDPSAATFTGQFVLTGSFLFGCPDCEGPAADEEMSLYFTPDPEVAARLPHWKEHPVEIQILIYPQEEFLKALPAERAALRAGKLGALTGRASIVVDTFATSIDCDAVSFSARFVAFAEPAVVQEARTDGPVTCG